MGNPKLPRRKYDTPSHPWQGDRIKLENDLIKKFGLKNKREVWKMQSQLRNFRQQARLLNARLRMADLQAEKEKNQLLTRLVKLGLLNPNSDLNDVLGLEVENILNRRLQTQVYLKGLAHTPKQARQFIIHGHVSIDGRKVTIPGYLVKHNEEGTIEYNQYSSLTNELHPMRPKAKVEVSVGDGQVSRLISIKTSASKEADETGPETGETETENKTKSESKTESKPPTDNAEKKTDDSGDVSNDKVVEDDADKQSGGKD
jgi:small subunit ribosomal protein S4